MDNAEWLAVLSASGLMPVMARMNEEEKLCRYFEPRQVIGGVVGGIFEEEEVWVAKGWLPGRVFSRADALTLSRELARAGVSPEGEDLG
jgi:hypothetical protein